MSQELSLLLNILPIPIEKEEGLIEIILDLGRPVELRYLKSSVKTDTILTKELLQSTLDQLGNFNKYNRCIIPNTLHRISRILSTNKNTIGLTCRVGLAHPDCSIPIRDLIDIGKGILIVGPPSCGKTTLIRDIGNYLSKSNRVVIVDSSNEIAGEGDTPHHSVGNCRRMQIPYDSTQARVLIECVQNHMPEVIIVDEIGNREDVAAARTIAERGVQLIATAHGKSLEDIVNNPMLSDLVGGCQAVILSDREAQKRKCQKTVIERKFPPTFDIIIEMLDYTTFKIHKNSLVSVDNYLLGKEVETETRSVDSGGRINITRPVVHKPEETKPESNGKSKIFSYGIQRRKVVTVLEELHVPHVMVNDPGQADVIISLKKNETKFLNYKGKLISLRVGDKAHIYDSVFEATSGTTAPYLTRQ